MTKQKRTKKLKTRYLTHKELADSIAKQFAKTLMRMSPEKLVDELIRVSHTQVGSCGAMSASPYLDRNVRLYSEEILRRLNKKSSKQDDEVERFVKNGEKFLKWWEGQPEKRNTNKSMVFGGKQ